jgi:P-type E1-E2 ATPase
MYDDYRSVVPLSIFNVIAIIQHMIENKDRIIEQLKINSRTYEIQKDKFIKIIDIKINDEIHLNLHKDIPADIKIKSGKLVVNEYNLTGEKIDIIKYENDIVYRGTNIIDGYAIGSVANIGNSCKIYNINYNFKEKVSWIENRLYKLCLTNLYILCGMSILFATIIYFKYNVNKLLHLLLLFNTLIPLKMLTLSDTRI